MRTKKEAYLEMIQAELQEWDAKIEQVEATARKKAAEAKMEFADDIDDLREKRHEIVTKMQEIRKASDGAWEKMKGSMEHAWTEMKGAVENATDRIRQ